MAEIRLPCRKRPLRPMGFFGDLDTILPCCDGNCREPHLWGYPATLTIEVDGETIDVSDAIVEERGRFVLDSEKVLNVIDAFNRRPRDTGTLLPRL